MTRTLSPTSKGGSTSAIIAEIKAAIPRKYRHSAWYERLSPEQEEIVQAIHRAWHAGELGPFAQRAAVAISKRLRDYGIEIGTQGIIRWLRLPPQS